MGIDARRRKAAQRSLAMAALAALLWGCTEPSPPGSPSPASGAPGADRRAQDKADFLRVKEWTGTFEVRFGGAERFDDPTSWDMQYAHSAKVELSANGTFTYKAAQEIKEIDLQFHKGRQWIGGGEMQVRYDGHVEKIPLKTEMRRHPVKGDAKANRNGTLMPDCYLMIHLDDGEGTSEQDRSYTYWLNVGIAGGWFTIDQTTTNFTQATNNIQDTGIVERSQVDGNLGFYVTQIPLPKTGLRLKGSRQIPAVSWAKSVDFPDDRFDFQGSFPFHWLYDIWDDKKQPPDNVTVSWDISPVIGRQELPGGGAPGGRVPGGGAPGADLALTVRTAAGPVPVGAELVYKLAVTNKGPGTAIGTVLTDNLPAEVRFISATPSRGSCSGTSTVVCNLADLENGGSATVVIATAPTAAGTLSNSANVLSGVPDINPADNSATSTTRAH